MEQTILTFITFGMFCTMAYMDIKQRFIRRYWFIGFAAFVILYKLIFLYDTLYADFVMSGVALMMITFGFIMRLYASGDFLGLIIASIAVPTIHNIPFGLVLIIITLIIQSYVMIIGNMVYNISDRIRGNVIYDIKAHKVKKFWWSMISRRRRDNDKFVLPADRRKKGIRYPSIKPHKLSDETRYVRSAYPQYVFSSVVFTLLIIYGISGGAFY